MKNSHLQGSKGNGIVEFLRKYKFEGNGVTYFPGDFEHFELTIAKDLASKKIVKHLNK